LDDKVHCTKIADIESSSLHITWDVQQGSVFGHLLEKPPTLIPFHVLIIAIFTFQAKTIKNLQKLLNSELKELISWFILSNCISITPKVISCS